MSIAILPLLLATTAAAAPIPENRLPSIASDSQLPGAGALREDPRSAVLARDLRRTMAYIDDRRKSGEITREEARTFRQEAGLILGMRRQLGTDGLSNSELQSIELRIQALKAAAQLSTHSR